MVPWDQILNFLALRPNAGPTQTHVGYRCTPYDFLVHVDHVFFEDKFFGFRSILHRCAYLEIKHSQSNSSGLHYISPLGPPGINALKNKASCAIRGHVIFIRFSSVKKRTSKRSSKMRGSVIVFIVVWASTQLPAILGDHNNF